MIVADRLHALLSSRTLRDAVVDTVAPVADLSGRWDVRIEYAAGSSMHALHLRQKGNEIDGTHQGDFVARDLTGTISGSDVRIRSNYGGVWRCAPVSLHGKADRRRDGGRARHGGVSGRSVVSEAPVRKNEKRMVASLSGFSRT